MLFVVVLTPPPRWGAPLYYKKRSGFLCILSYN